MPNYTADFEVARLMTNVAGFLNTSFSCVSPGSGAFISSIPNVFKNSTFQYANASYMGAPAAEALSYHILITELTNSQPVILAGFTGTFLGLWPTGSGHAWVCDGYQRTIYSSSGQPPSEYAYFNMNWGWSGEADGFYYQNDWAPRGVSYNFQYHKELVGNIRP